MSTPEIPQTPANDPADPTPPVPEPNPEEAAAQQAAQEKAAAEAALNDQIRSLAAEIASQAILAFDPATIRKGTVISIQGGAPPTITVTISGAETVEVSGVRYYEHYVPEVADTVHLLKQGTDLVAIGKIAGQQSETSFTTVTLQSGFTHNGNGNGDLMVRRVWDNGLWKVQFQGGVNRSSGTVVAVLDTKYRPVTCNRRTVALARTANGGANILKADIQADGSIELVGMTTAPESKDPGDTNSTTLDENAHQHTGTTSVASPGDSSHQHSSHEHVIPAVNAGPSEHNHSGAVSTVSHSHGTHNHTGTTNVESLSVSTHNHGTHEHGIDTVFHTHGSHIHTMPSHAHDVQEPTWVSFNGVEYFL